MMTSCFARLRHIPPGMEPVAISRGIPQWYTGRVEQRLAPTWAMLRMSIEEYDRHFKAILEKLDPWEMYNALGPNTVLLCWEPPGVRCHRRLVAEWFERNLGITVTELGFPRSAIPSYENMPTKQTVEEDSRGEKVPQLKIPANETTGFRQGVLFPW